ncbi:MAG: Phospho-N-acetylmuramoyl-pentapeptide-transferase [Candidatus Anoxychlamydiales bacterium]|nr:Phospho-N-acetylmuramoyl-pentapeptide-transferase [Candidatus Anoxychlamydiales bacterium]NGX36589.1 Phospho-N-acetylmuramoyl-pentapeptide-transferase [Candidatus Anoxychlamydiales bacterium]
MLLLLIKYLYSLFHMTFPSVFTYTSTRMMLSAITSLIITIFFGPLFIKKLYVMKVGQKIRTKESCPLLAELHEKKKDTPTMGGILILFSMIISLILWMDLSNIFTVILLITTLWLGLVGALDDYLKLKHKNSKGLPSKLKFLLQIIFAVFIAIYLLWPVGEKIAKKEFLTNKLAKEHIVKAKTTNISKGINISSKEYFSRLYIPFYKKPIVFKGVWIFFIFILMVFVITGTSNAVNLTDGLDGLAAGCLVMVAVSLGLFAFLSNHIQMARYLNIIYLENSSEIAIYLFAIAGACLGFLWYNGFPAQIFMGDTGSLALGGVIGVSAILLRREVLLAIVGGIFVAEALSVILQVLSYKYRNKKRIFLCSPLHHHFEYKGWPETKVVLRFWIIGLLLAIIGVASLKFQ